MVLQVLQSNLELTECMVFYAACNGISVQVKFHLLAIKFAFSHWRFMLLATDFSPIMTTAHVIHVFPGFHPF